MRSGGTQTRVGSLFRALSREPDPPDPCVGERRRKTPYARPRLSCCSVARGTVASALLNLIGQRHRAWLCLHRWRASCLASLALRSDQLSAMRPHSGRLRVAQPYRVWGESVHRSQRIGIGVASAVAKNCASSASQSLQAKPRFVHASRAVQMRELVVQPRTETRDGPSGHEPKGLGELLQEVDLGCRPGAAYREDRSSLTTVGGCSFAAALVSAARG